MVCGLSIILRFAAHLEAYTLGHVDLVVGNVLQAGVGSLGQIGALLGLWLMNRAVGLTSVFGFITLVGMIMRNEILIFEHANDMRRHGLSVRDAAYDAGRRRMVPIFLTTATTAVGVVPMIIAATNFWMPVGVTIFAGGIGSLILVVTVLPVVYWKLFEKKKISAQ